MMKLEGTYRFAAKQAEVWAALNDPLILQQATPGCKEFREVEPDHYEAALELGVAGIKGRYNGRITLTEKQAPDRYRLTIEGNGSPGFVRTALLLHLTAPDEGSTDLTYGGEAQVGGLVAGVGQRILGGVARMMMDQFFRAIDKAMSH